MTTITTPIGSVDSIGAAQARAVNDVAFAAMFKQAGKAGAIVGAGTNGKAATAFLSVVADELAKPAMVILKIRNREDGKPGADTLPTLAAASGLLLELCGLVNHAIEQAQAEARKSAIQRMKAAEMTKAAKNARNALVTKLDRALAPYGITVNFSAGTCADRELTESDSPAEKACKRVVLAFGVDVRGALDGLAALDPQAWAYVVAHVSRINAERTAEAADENAAALQVAADALAAKAAATTDGKVKPIAEQAAKVAAEQAAKARQHADELAAALKAVA